MPDEMQHTFSRFSDPGVTEIAASRVLARHTPLTERARPTSRNICGVSVPAP
jgi:hypothetical protein